ncbi:NMT1/THI5 like protein [Caloramator mitchellensis]|uniref:NMT1/THI5 like protein n=1 Tax=Caloramator mitchellensis TaxID=908809 RepID=A0A0R3JUQ0_CALMK|nr:ABC transporter substrate-binding protein [Caloramator mitchellensis]KRQ87240.1 NMT1/THI5 like protein [Caloramator mitchellensis]
MKKYLKLVSLALILFSTISFISCNKPKNTELTKIRLNEVVRSIFYAPMYAAINKGFFKEEGLEIELSTGQGADKTMQQVLSKNADIGFCGPEQVIYLYNQGRDDYAVLFAQLTKRDGSFLVGRNKEEDFKWESLRGKTVIGGRPGGVPEMTLEYVLRNHGIAPNKDIQIITNLAFTATAQAFKSGTGDYVALFEPTASMLEKEGGSYIVASVGKASGEIPYTCFFTTKSYLENYPDIIQRFTNAIYKGQLWVESHNSKEIADAVIDFFPGSDIELLTTVVERYKAQDTWAKNPILKEEALSRLMDIIQSYNSELLPSRPPYEKIVTNKFAEEAIKNIK